jgi:hypothetical protein
MKYRWLILNAIIFFASIAFGYLIRGQEFSPYTGALVGFIFGVFAILVSFRAVAAKNHYFRRPSLNRPARIYWWNDPLQFYFIWSVYLFGIALGNRSYLSWGVLMGVILGQIILYRVYRDRIKQAEQGAAANP